MNALKSSGMLICMYTLENDFWPGGVRTMRVSKLYLCVSILFFPIARLNIVYPMLFKLTNKKADRMSHSGVLEFVADEGKVYLPYWVSFVVNIDLNRRF